MTYGFEHKFSHISIIRHIASSLTIPTSTILTDDGRVLMWLEEDNRRLKEQWSCYQLFNLIDFDHWAINP